MLIVMENITVVIMDFLIISMGITVHVHPIDISKIQLCVKHVLNMQLVMDLVHLLVVLD